MGAAEGLVEVEGKELVSIFIRGGGSMSFIEWFDHMRTFFVSVGFVRTYKTRYRFHATARGSACCQIFWTSETVVQDNSLAAFIESADPTLYYGELLARLRDSITGT